MLNVQKYVVVIGTSDARRRGGRRHDTRAVQPVDPQQLADHPVKVVTDAGFGCAVLVIGVAVIAVAFQTVDHPSLGDRALQPLGRDVDDDRPRCS